jgi:type II secretory pathway pseudopilin PulG
VNSNLARNKGYLLVEVLTTVVILGVAIVFIVRGLNASLIASRRAADYTQALFLMEQLEAELKLETRAFALSQDSFPRSAESGLERIKFNWQQDLSDFPAPNLSEIIFTLSWKDARLSGGFDASTLVPIVGSQ